MAEATYKMGSKRPSLCGVVEASFHRRLPCLLPNHSPCPSRPTSPSAQILEEYQQYLSAVPRPRPSHGPYVTREPELDPYPYAALPPMLKIESPTPIPSLASYVPATYYGNHYQQQQQQWPGHVMKEVSLGMTSRHYSVPASAFASEPAYHKQVPPRTTRAVPSPSPALGTTPHNGFFETEGAANENLPNDDEDSHRRASSGTTTTTTTTMTMDHASQTTISVRGSVSSLFAEEEEEEEEESRCRRICAVVRAIHDVCLQSTQTYLQAHRANRLARSAAGGEDDHQHQHQHASPHYHCHYPHHHHHHHHHSHQHHGTATPTTNNAANDSSFSVFSSFPGPGPGLEIIPKPTASLLQNTSSICTMLWTGAQRDRLDVLDVERLAVENMGSLLAWAETVALGDCDEWRRSFSSSSSSSFSTTTTTATTTATVAGGPGMTTRGGGGGEGLSLHRDDTAIINGGGDGGGVGAGQRTEMETTAAAAAAAAAAAEEQRETALWRVFEAGTNLCAWLGVEDGVEAMAVLEGDIWGRGGVGEGRGMGYGM